MFGFLRFTILAGAVCAAALGQAVVVPNSDATVVGGDTSGSLVGSFPARYQILINPGQFPAGALYVTGFSFRAAPGLGALSVNGAGNIYASTSPNYANNLGHPVMSTTFADNVGPDNQLVFSGSFSINGPACGGPSPCPFANVVTLQTPFLYNRGNGPLLLDLQMTSFGGPGPGQFDVYDCSETGPNYCVEDSMASLAGSPTATLNGGNNVTEITGFAPPQFPSGSVFTCAGSSWCLWSYGEAVNFSAPSSPLFAISGTPGLGELQSYTTTAAFTFPPPAGNSQSVCGQSVTPDSAFGFISCGSGTTTSTIDAISVNGQLEAGAWLDASQYPMHTGSVVNGQTAYAVAGGTEMFFFGTSGPFPPPTAYQSLPTDSVARFTFVVHGTPAAQGVSAAKVQTGFWFGYSGMPCPDYPCAGPAPTWAFYPAGASPFETVVQFDVPYVGGEVLLTEFNLAAAAQVTGDPSQGAQTYSAETSLDLTSTATLAQIQLFSGTPGNLGQQITNMNVVSASGTSYTASGILTNPCDLRGDGSIDVADVQLIVNEALGVTLPAIDLNRDGMINALDAQIEVNAAVGSGCAAN